MASRGFGLKMSHGYHVFASLPGGVFRPIGGLCRLRSAENAPVIRSRAIDYVIRSHWNPSEKQMTEVIIDLLIDLARTGGPDFVVLALREISEIMWAIVAILVMLVIWRLTPQNRKKPK
jgi:hypothetical protein